MSVTVSAPPLVPTPAPTPVPTVVRSLVILGDSTPAGLGDPMPGGGWRGFGPLLADALGPPGTVSLTNLSTIGGRMTGVRQEQLPAALAAKPQATVIVVGMNDTLRSDFDPVRLHAEYDEVVGALRAAGSAVLTTRYHDHSEVFWLPGPLSRALRTRIAQLNAATDAVAARHGAAMLDLHTMPGGYDKASWSVDRLHPSELGHRMLASGFADLLRGAGFAVTQPVSLTCGGGRQVTAAHHAAWLVVKGVPWLCRRGRDLVPYAVSAILQDRRARTQSESRKRAIRSSASSSNGSAVAYEQRMWPAPGAPNTLPGTTATRSACSSLSANVSSSSPEVLMEGNA